MLLYSIEPLLSYREIVCWLKKIWEQFPLEIVKNLFTGGGYFFENTADHSRDTKSESDVESLNQQNLTFIDCRYDAKTFYLGLTSRGYNSTRSTVTVSKKGIFVKVYSKKLKRGS